MKTYQNVISIMYGLHIIQNTVLNEVMIKRIFKVKIIYVI